MVMISERPSEVADRAVPGHWEGDLIVGSNSRSAIATLVERSTRYLMMVHLPNGHAASAVRQALADTVQTLPPHLKRSLTWDQGAEMAAHHAFSLATNIPVSLRSGQPLQPADQRDTNGLCGKVTFPKGSDLSRHSRNDLDAVAAELNSRPRKTTRLGTPAECLAKLWHSQVDHCVLLRTPGNSPSRGLQWCVSARRSNGREDAPSRAVGGRCPCPRFGGLRAPAALRPN
nr:IS30 family transposase [Streptomyces sp. DHE17-7]